MVGQLLAIGVVLLVPIHLSAQQTRDYTGYVRVGAGLGLATSEVGGEKSSKVGPVVSATFGSGGKLSVAVQAEYQPFKVANPVKAEAYRVLFVLPSLELRFHTLSDDGVAEVNLRGGIGLARFWWSGPEAGVPSENGVALSLSAGLRSHAVLAGRLMGEIGVQSGASSDFSASAGLLSIRVLAVWPRLR